MDVCARKVIFFLPIAGPTTTTYRSHSQYISGCTRRCYPNSVLHVGHECVPTHRFSVCTIVPMLDLVTVSVSDNPIFFPNSNLRSSQLEPSAHSHLSTPETANPHPVGGVGAVPQDPPRRPRRCPHHHRRVHRPPRGVNPRGVPSTTPTHRLFYNHVYC